MKNGKNASWVLGLCALIAILSGCGKSESAPPEKPAAPAPAAAAPAAPAPPNAAEIPKATAEKAAAEVGVAEKKAETVVVDKVQGLIDSAKTLVAANKFEEALKIVTDLSATKLTDAQQKLVDALKEQINKAIASKGVDEAKKALGGLVK